MQANRATKRPQNPNRLYAAATAHLRRFSRDEDGALIILALVFLWLMVFMGSFAIDVMRFETTRTTLQNTLDRATLAAASLTQTLDAEDVVNDYFAKAGLTDYLGPVSVREGINFREVEATAVALSNPISNFMDQPDMASYMTTEGNNSWRQKGLNYTGVAINGHSMAEQRVTNVEITLVLDISGSMNSNSKLTNLKTAAKEFVDTVLSSDPEHRIAIALVPFNGQVNLGTVLGQKYNRTLANNSPGVDCVDLPASTYNQLGMSRSLALPMTADADTYSSTNQTTSYVSTTDSNAVPNDANLWCPSSTTNIVRLPSTDAVALKGYIQGLTAVGATSINAGLNWGMALMDPGARPMFSQLISANKMQSFLEGRPYDYDDREAMKVIVLMTDGEHFAEERVTNDYKSGNSVIYKGTDGNYSIYHATRAGSSKYWVPYNATWQSTPWKSGTVQTWQQVWSNMRLSYVAWQFYARAFGSSGTGRTNAYNDAMALFKVVTPTGTMDTQLASICTKSKTAGVTIYGIAFEAPTNGQAAISNCASSPAHYFNAQGLQIKTAFRTIASNISQLRLTQ